MKTWYIKAFAELTGVTVRTLHHYDTIGLLKPSQRGQNGYRVYTEKDLQHLQVIIALKQFGFELTKIQELLSKDIDLADYFALQLRILEKKAQEILDAKDILQRVILDCHQQEALSWEDINQLIGVYSNMKQLEKTWAGEVLNEDELKAYAEFETSLATRFSEKEKDAFEARWADFAARIKENLNTDPTSEIGIQMGEECHRMIAPLYGKQFANVKHMVWEKGFKGVSFKEDLHGMSKEMVEWLDKAMSTYWRSRLLGILAKVGTEPEDMVAALWEEALSEMEGDDKTNRAEVINVAMEDPDISDEAKAFLQRLSLD